MGEVRPLVKACTCVYYEMALGCCQEILPPTPNPHTNSAELPDPSTKL